MWHQFLVKFRNQIFRSTGLPSKRCPGVRFLSRVDREFGIFQHLAPTMRLLCEFPHETGLIQRFAGNVGNPLQTKHGSRPSCCDQEGWRGSQEVVPWTLVFPSSETGMSGNFGGRIKGAKYRCVLQDGTWDFSWYAVAAKGLILRWRGSHVVFLELRRGFQASSCVGPGKSNHPFELLGRAGGCARVTAGQRRPHLGLCPGPNVPLQGPQGSQVCIPASPRESGLVLKGNKGLRSPFESRRAPLGAHFVA